jgi:hypothetical protein
LIAAALLIGGAYFAFKDHVLFSKRRFGEEVPGGIANIFGSIYAIVAIVVLWYAWRLYRPRHENAVVGHVDRSLWSRLSKASGQRRMKPEKTFHRLNLCHHLAQPNCMKCRNSSGTT